MKLPTLTKQKKLGTLVAFIWSAVLVTIGGMGTLDYNGITLSYLKQMYGSIAGSIRFVALGFLDNVFSLAIIVTIFALLIYFLGQHFIKVGYALCLVLFSVALIIGMQPSASEDYGAYVLVALCRALIILILPVTVLNHLIIKRVKN